MRLHLVHEASVDYNDNDYDVVGPGWMIGAYLSAHEADAALAGHRAELSDGWTPDLIWGCDTQDDVEAAIAESSCVRSVPVTGERPVGALVDDGEDVIWLVADLDKDSFTLSMAVATVYGAYWDARQAAERVRELGRERLAARGDDHASADEWVLGDLRAVPYALHGQGSTQASER